MVTTESGIIAIEVLAAQGPVGTRGRVEWMRGPCACPRWGATCLLHAVPTGSRCHQDKHQAPSLPHIRPLSLQDPIRSSKFIRGNALTPPPPGDHQGLVKIPRIFLAPTDHPASYLSSRLRLMPIGALCGRHGGSIQDNSLSTPPTNFITLSTNSAATRVYFSGGIKPAYF